VTNVAEDIAETRLDRWLEDGPRSWRDILQVFIAVGRKLAAAHADGVLYQEIAIENIVVSADGHAELRDLKPAVLEVPGDGPKVGTGPLRTAAIPLEQRLAEMKSMEAVTFLAPEQFRGRSADARSNQFSYGVALYRALYRQAPFDYEWAVSQAGESRRTPLGSIHFDLLVQSFDRATLINLAREVLSGNLRPSPDDTDVPAWLELVLRRALQTDPDERYPSMVQLLDDLTKESYTPITEASERHAALPRWAVVGGIGALILLVALVVSWLGHAP
jgi:serine/threonine protein kinase